MSCRHALALGMLFLYEQLERVRPFVQRALYCAHVELLRASGRVDDKTTCPCCESSVPLTRLINGHCWQCDMCDMDNDVA